MKYVRRDKAGKICDVLESPTPGTEAVNEDSAELLNFFNPPPNAYDVKREAASRIEARYPIYKQINIMRAGGQAAGDMGAWIDAVRSSSNALEVNVPVDYTNDKYWPK